MTTTIAIENAKKDCIKLHEGQTRKKTGEPYHVHPFSVAKTIKDMGYTEEMICAAYLHDVYEDCLHHFNDSLSEAFEYVSCKYGDKVAQLVYELTNRSNKEDGNRATRKAIDNAHLSTASAEAQTIKCADILDNTSEKSMDDNMRSYYIPEKIKQIEVLTKAHPDLLNMLRKRFNVKS